VLRTAWLLNRPERDRGRPEALRADEAFALATIDGFRAVGLGDVAGSIEVGQQADLVVLDTRDIAWVPRGDIARQLVWGAASSSVRDVVVAGRIVVRDRQILTVDLDRLRREAAQRSAALLRRAGIEVPHRWPRDHRTRVRGGTVTMTVIDLAGRTPAQKQGLLSQLIVPRPIAMISTLDEDGGLNVAPFSYYMPISGEPPMLAVTVGALHESGRPKGHLAQSAAHGRVRHQRDHHRAQRAHRDRGAGVPARVSEAEIAGWNAVPSQRIQPPSLAESPAHLECVVREVIDRGDQLSCFSGVHIVLAEVVCITVDDSITAEPNRIDPTRVHAVGRMGFPWFVAAEENPCSPSNALRTSGPRTADDHGVVAAIRPQLHDHQHRPGALVSCARISWVNVRCCFPVGLTRSGYRFLAGSAGSMSTAPGHEQPVQEDRPANEIFLPIRAYEAARAGRSRSAGDLPAPTARQCVWTPELRHEHLARDTSVRRH